MRISFLAQTSDVKRDIQPPIVCVDFEGRKGERCREKSRQDEGSWMIVKHQAGP